MEETEPSGYSEEISFQGNNPLQFISTLQEAAMTLNWHLLHIAPQQRVYQTPISDHSRGELVYINLKEDSALLHIVALNEYYWSEDQQEAVVTQLKEEMNVADEQRKISQRSRHPMHREKYGALFPSKTYLATPIILYSCALLFLIMLLFGVSPLTPTAKSLFEWGGNFREAVINGEWWRLITYMFLHAGAMHLIMNGFALLYVGMFLEPLITRSRMVIAYLLTGIIAGISSIIMHPLSVGVGASGAIFGLYGVFFALLTTGYFQKTARMTMMRSLLFFIVFNLLMGLQGNTDNAAHIGGLISGILIGYIYYPHLKRKAAEHISG